LYFLSNSWFVNRRQAANGPKATGLPRNKSSERKEKIKIKLCLWEKLNVGQRLDW